jgi:hypothetical protein
MNRTRSLLQDSSPEISDQGINNGMWTYSSTKYGEKKIAI